MRSDLEKNANGGSHGRNQAKCRLTRRLGDLGSSNQGERVCEEQCVTQPKGRRQEQKKLFVKDCATAVFPDTHKHRGKEDTNKTTHLGFIPSVVKKPRCSGP